MSFATLRPLCRCLPSTVRGLTNRTAAETVAFVMADSSETGRPFLRAEWRWLVMLNYEVDPSTLAPLLPRGVELDLWEGRAIASMDGFRFLRTKVLGVPIPWHTDFDEVNLRFYVRREVRGELRRGVVFVKEIVPKSAIARTARTLYGENYVTHKMRHRVEPEHGIFDYEWNAHGRWNRISARTSGESAPLAPGSEAEFTFEHYYGYTRRSAERTIEYRVNHPKWCAWAADSCEFSADIAALYGPQFVAPLSAKPRASFVADGSPVTVGHGHELPISPGAGLS